MDAATFLNGGGIGMAVALIVGFWRALVKGDIVLGREYSRLVTDTEGVAKRADVAAQEAKEAASRERDRTALLIETQAAQVAAMNAIIAQMAPK